MQLTSLTRIVSDARLVVAARVPIQGDHSPSCSSPLVYVCALQSYVDMVMSVDEATQMRGVVAIRQVVSSFHLSTQTDDARVRRSRAGTPRPAHAAHRPHATLTVGFATVDGQSVCDDGVT
jgi:hypothetical protein